MTTLQTTPVMAEVLHAKLRAGRLPANLISVVAGSILIAACAQLTILLPFSPVPITGQTFAILVVAALLGPRLGTAAVLTYLAQGAAGLPVFAGFGAGPLHFAGPTAGYLFGFLPAAWLVGTLSARGWDRRFATTFAAMVLGTAIIFVFGALWLTVLFGPRAAVTLGVIPFLPGALVKIIAAALLLPRGWTLLRWLERSRA